MNVGFVRNNVDFFQCISRRIPLPIRSTSSPDRKHGEDDFGRFLESASMLLGPRRSGDVLSQIFGANLTDRHYRVCPYIVSEPVAWNGFFLVFAVRAAALVSVLTRVVPESYHVDVE